MHTGTRTPMHSGALMHAPDRCLARFPEENGLQPMRWFARITEYAVGAAMVLAHLALAGRIPTLVDRFEHLEEHRPRRRPRLGLG